MVNTTGKIAVISSSDFDWTAEIQYKESLETLEDAVRYASRLGANMIVKYSLATGVHFDVMHDPNLHSASDLGADAVDSVQMVPVIVEPERHGWIRLVFRSVFSLFRRIGATASAVPTPSSQPVAAK
jgi:sugar phosphate isomerase/epimerase